MVSSPLTSETFPAFIGLVCILFLLWISGCMSDSDTLGEAGKEPPPEKIITIPGPNEVSSSLRAVINKMEDRGITRQNARELGASTLSNPLVRVTEDGNIQTYIYVHRFESDEKALLEKYEVTIEIVNEKLGIVQAWIPFDRIYEVAQLPFVSKITPPSYGTPRARSVKP